ncbi:methyltransferase domain-containing protein [Rhizobium sp. KVB221]|uniref:Methyltransferase domain-containing protein n=1 Tax=Rhizobium setariae TaxID=2801340 RepID=A0A937CRN7_9HYPH|nr:methyltransferase domain-containing protein [Rhizobium setariae]MBL0374947.1 methyltransferase domain-containing protein [Rhizobium setariae]
MTASDKIFSENIPAIYEKYLVPMIFEPYAQEIAARVAALEPANVLEIAAGTGVLTRAMAARLDPQVQVIATDLNQPMLDIAMARQTADDRFGWKQADALALPFDDQSFDAVACQFGVMFFPDKVKGFSEVRRVLATGGRYVFSVWDRLAANEFVSVTSEALAELFPDDPPRFMERTPHGYHDIDAIARDMKAAGFSSPHIETVECESAAASALDAATGYCQGNPLRGEIEARAPGRLEEITGKVAEALQARFGQGPITGRIRAHIVTALR